MSERDTILRRVIARLRALLDEDWSSKAGERFRRGISSISDFNEEHLHLQDKAAEAPDLLWRAAQGLAGERHAKAVADYSKAENEQIDLALKKRVLDDKARQERAVADKLEAEAAIAKLNELKARAELARTLQDLGIAMVVDNEGNVRVTRCEPQLGNPISEIFTLPEKRLLNLILDVVIPFDGLPVKDAGPIVLVRWLCKVGQDVRQDEPIFEVENDYLSAEVPCPANGIITEILADPGATVVPGETVVCVIEKRTKGSLPLPVL